MTNLPFSFSNCLRHAFYTGAGYGDLDKISETDQARWTAYDPSDLKPFQAVTAALEGASKNATLPKIAAQFDYTNYKGEHETRNVYPIGVWYGSTAWHPEKQWFLHAFDIDRDGHRDFALKDIGSVR